MTVLSNSPSVVRPTEEQTISAVQAAELLRGESLLLFAYKADGRYICKITDENQNVVSITSRTTLQDAVTISVLHIKH